MVLNDICDLIVDCPHTTSPDMGKGYPLIRTPNIGKGRFLLDGVHRVSEKTYNDRNARAIPQEDDLIFAREAPAGNVAIIKNEEKFCLGQRTVLVRPNKERVIPDYLVYYLLAPQQQHNLLATANGATVPHVNLSTIRGMEVSLPPLPVQRRIADILSAYDDLIENNQKQIKLLEEAAVRLYKEWFVYLRFPGHENTPIVDGVPEGWRKNRADKFFHITIGKTPPRSESKWFSTKETDIKWVSIADMGKQDVFITNTSECIIEDAVDKVKVKIVPANTVLLSFKLTVGRVAICEEPMTTNEAIAHFWQNTEYEREYVYLMLKNYHYDSLGSTSAISTAINSKIVKAMLVVMPDDNLLVDFCKLTRPLFDKILVCNKQIQFLRNSRDKLLPKLISGEIKV